MKSQLFLGFAIDSLFSRKLDLVSPEVKNLFISEKDDYLNSFEHEGIPYLGKKLKNPLAFDDLQLQEMHIYSLLRRLVAEHPYENSSLILIGTSC